MDSISLCKHRLTPFYSNEFTWFGLCVRLENICSISYFAAMIVFSAARIQISVKCCQRPFSLSFLSVRQSKRSQSHYRMKRENETAVTFTRGQLEWRVRRWCRVRKKMYNMIDGAKCTNDTQPMSAWRPDSKIMALFVYASFNRSIIWTVLHI